MMRHKSRQFIDRVTRLGYWKKGGFGKLNFDAVVGNPPYQENIEHRGEQPPVYHLFYDNAISLSDIVTLITPARFLFDVGKTPSDWNKKMLNDEHFKVVKYFEDSKEIFENVDIKGGVSITLRDGKRKSRAIKVFIPNEQVKNILDKVKQTMVSSLSDIMYSNTSYRYNKAFFDENPEYIKRVSGGSSRYLSSSVFSKFPESFFEESPNDGKKYIKILGRKNNKRVLLYFDRSYINPPDNFEKYKVYLASSNGTGQFGEKLSTPEIGEPLIGATETFVSFGAFDNRTEAESLVKYLKCKFTRLLLGTRKVTQGNKNSKVWSNVATQDFSITSDIDWSKSVKEIDNQLYKKYQLTQNEINFIEDNIKPME